MARFRPLMSLASLAALTVTWAITAGAAPPGGGSTPPPNPAIAFAESNGIKVMNADGTNVKTVVSVHGNEFARAPAWSPDSAQLVFHGRFGGIAGVYRAPVAGGSPILVTPTIDTSYLVHANPDWSPVPTPDGQHKIVYSDLRADGASRDLYVINPDGTGKLNLSQTVASYETSPSWSPDGTRIVTSDLGAAELVVLDLGVVDGSLAVVQRTTVYAGQTAFPRWAKTGDAVAFSLFVDNVYRIATLDVADPFGIPVLLTPSSATDERWPSYSPDDSRLVFHRGGTGTSGIYTINADGSGQLKINNKGYDPNWRRAP